MEKSQSRISQVSLPLLFGTAILLSVSSTVLHFLKPGSLSELVVSFAGVICISSVIRFASEVVLGGRRRDCAGILNGLFGTETCLAIVAAMKGESVIAQNVLKGAQISYCLMIVGTCIGFGGFRQAESRLLATRLTAQLLIASFFSMVIPVAFEFHSQGNSMTRLRMAATLILSLQSAQLHERSSNEPDETARKEAKPCFSLFASIAILLCSQGAMILSTSYLVEALDASGIRAYFPNDLLGVTLAAIVVASVEHITAGLRCREGGYAWISKLIVRSNPPLHLFILLSAIHIKWFPEIANSLIVHECEGMILTLTILILDGMIQSKPFYWVHSSAVILIVLFIAITM